jgi:O-antigen/teichoic acid export membrane protein
VTGLTRPDRDRDTADAASSQLGGEAARPSNAEEVGQGIATGGLFMVLGNVAALPAGLLASALLARALGPADFGVYSVALSLIDWARATINMVLNRASIKLIAETPRWEPIATALAQIQLLLGGAAGLLIFLAAPVLTRSLGSDLMEPVLRVMAVALPLYSWGQAYSNTLNGRCAFGRSALLPLVASLSRLLLIVVLVGGLGLMGAAWAYVAVAVALLFFARRWLHLPLWRRVSWPRRQFVHYSLPLFLDTLARRLHKRADLWAVQTLVGTAAAGQYSVAVNFNSAGRIFSSALSPVVLATVSDAWAQGKWDLARTVIRQTLRLSLWLLPFAALGAGAAPALVQLLFGEAYLPAAPLLAWVAFSIAAQVLMTVSAAIIAAVGRPGATVAFGGPLLVLALVGYVLTVPRAGALGAAVTTAVTEWGVALATLWAIHRWCQVSPGLKTLARITVTSVIAYGLARAWQAPGVWVIPQLLALCGIVLVLLFLLGEVTSADVVFVRSLLSRQLTGWASGRSASKRRP